MTFRNPINGAIVKVSKESAFWLTLFFGCFYLAYKEAWIHAGIALLIALGTGPLWFVFWFVYAFFAYRIIVDTYVRKGWIEIEDQPAAVASVLATKSSWLLFSYCRSFRQTVRWQSGGNDGL